MKREMNMVNNDMAQEVLNMLIDEQMKELQEKKQKKNDKKTEDFNNDVDFPVKGSNRAARRAARRRIRKNHKELAKAYGWNVEELSGSRAIASGDTAPFTGFKWEYFYDAPKVAADKKAATQEVREYFNTEFYEEFRAITHENDKFYEGTVEMSLEEWVREAKGWWRVISKYCCSNLDEYFFSEIMNIGKMFRDYKEGDLYLYEEISHRCSKYCEDVEGELWRWSKTIDHVFGQLYVYDPLHEGCYFPVVKLAENRPSSNLWNRSSFVDDKLYSRYENGKIIYSRLLGERGTAVDGGYTMQPYFMADLFFVEDDRRMYGRIDKVVRELYDEMMWEE